MVEQKIIDIEPEHLKMVQSVFARNLPFKQVWAYGSRVKFTARKTSDLDCAVFGATDSEIFKAQEAFDESDIPFEVQLLNWETIPDDFKENIKKEYFVLRRKSDWGEFKLDDIIEFYNGKSIKAFEKGRYFVYGANGVIGKSDDYKFEDCLIIGRVGVYCGEIEYSKEKFWASDNTIVAKNKPNIDLTYLYFLLKDLKLNKYAGGAAQPLLTQSVLKAVSCLVPQSKETQRKIAGILSAYDDLIEHNNKRIKILEEMAQKLYKEWFVDFKFPNHENTKFVESELGLIPEGWEVKKLGDCTEFLYGKALKAEERIAGNYPVYGSSGIVGYHNSPLVKEAGIIVGRKGNVGHVFMSNQPFYPIDTVYYIKSPLPKHYLYRSLQGMNFLNNDAAVPGLNRNQAYSLNMIIPAPEILEKYEQLIEANYKYGNLLEARNQNLRTTRDLLLPRLLSGELSVEHLDDLGAVDRK